MPTSFEIAHRDDILGTLTAGQRFLLEGDLADQVERIEVLAEFPCDLLKR